MSAREYMYPVLKQYYTDFDMLREDVVSVSHTEEGAKAHAATLNAKLTADEVSSEISFVVGTKVRIV